MVGNGQRRKGTKARLAIEPRNGPNKEYVVDRKICIMYSSMATILAGPRNIYRRDLLLKGVCDAETYFVGRTCMHGWIRPYGDILDWA